MMVLIIHSTLNVNRAVMASSSFMQNQSADYSKTWTCHLNNANLELIRGSRVKDDTHLVGSDTVDVDDEADTASLALIGRVVETVAGRATPRAAVPNAAQAATVCRSRPFHLLRRQFHFQIIQMCGVNFNKQSRCCLPYLKKSSWR